MCCRQHVCLGLIAICVQESVTMHPSVDRVGRDSRKYHAGGAFWEGRGHGYADGWINLGPDNICYSLAVGC